MIKKIVTFIAISLVTAIIFETCWNYWDGAKTLFRPLPVRPIYPWSFYTFEKQHIGAIEGYHKLANHPFVQYINMPNQKMPFFTINSQGFRGGEISKIKTKKRIIVVGGSSAFGTGAWSNEETFPEYLQKLLPDTEVINAAVIGHLSGNELVYLTYELVDLQPDLVIALDGYNEVSGQFYDYERDVHTLGSNVTFFTFQRRILKTKFTKSYNILYRFAICQTYIFRNINHAIDELWKRLRHEERLLLKSYKLFDANPELYQKRLMDISNTYVKNTVKMNLVAETFGAKFLSIRQPHLSSFSANQFDSWARAKDIRAFLTEVDKQLAEKKIRQIDLNDPKYPFSEGSFLDAIHPSDEGAALIAKIAAQYIQKEHLLDPVSSIETPSGAA